MSGFTWNLVLAAGGIGVLHTIVGPDHYVPFLAIARASGWTRSKTVVVTVLCGIAHVGGSFLLAGAGALVGLGVDRLELFEQGRGAIAAWLMIAFGAAYAAWGVRQAIRHRQGIAPHSHGDRVHIHRDGSLPHRHANDGARGSSVAFWTLLTVFVVGPCEPLIPLILLPASRGEWSGAIWVGLVFGAATVATMVGVVVLGLAGLRRVRLGPLERWGHVLAGGIVAASGLAVVMLGL